MNSGALAGKPGGRMGRPHQPAAAFSPKYLEKMKEKVEKLPHEAEWKGTLGLWATRFEMIKAPGFLAILDPQVRVSPDYCQTKYILVEFPANATELGSGLTVVAHNLLSGVEYHAEINGLLRQWRSLENGSWPNLPQNNVLGGGYVEYRWTGGKPAEFRLYGSSGKYGSPPGYALAHCAEEAKKGGINLF
ncbi:MAG: hypothetical protein NT051_00395 [Candidatus Micrarchaeota archaeon]|nr:hypothetical protein [Candidatus Micrarchaeota archaeon]